VTAIEVQEDSKVKSTNRIFLGQRLWDTAKHVIICILENRNAVASTWEYMVAVIH